SRPSAASSTDRCRPRGWPTSPRRPAPPRCPNRPSHPTEARPCPAVARDGRPTLGGSSAGHSLSKGETIMNTLLKRSLQLTLLGGGMWLIGTGIASADTPAHHHRAPDVLHAATAAVRL